MSGEQRLPDGGGADRASGTPALALSVEEARRAVVSGAQYGDVLAPLAAFAAAIRAESAEALRAATTRAERLERVARETLAVHKAWGRLPTSMMEANANLEHALSATEGGAQ